MSLFDQFAEGCRDYFKYYEYQNYQLFENENFLAHLKNEVKFLSNDSLLDHPNFLKNLGKIIRLYLELLDLFTVKKSRKKGNIEKDIAELNSIVSALMGLHYRLDAENRYNMIEEADYNKITEQIGDLCSSLAERIDKLELRRGTIEAPLLSDINKRFDNALWEFLRDKTDLSITDLAKDITALRKIFRKIFDNKPLKFFIPKD